MFNFIKIPVYEKGNTIAQATKSPAVQVNGKTGEIEAGIDGGERIFSIADTKKIVLAAGTIKDEKDFMELGELIRKCLIKQDNNKEEFTKE